MDLTQGLMTLGKTIISSIITKFVFNQAEANKIVLTDEQKNNISIIIANLISSAEQILMGFITETIKEQSKPENKD